VCRVNTARRNFCWFLTSEWDERIHRIFADCGEYVIMILS
jgi:hypothetical protein